MAELAAIMNVLMDIKQDIGALKQDMASSISQRTLLFSEVNNVRTAVAGLETAFDAHVASFEKHIEDEKQIITKIALVEKDVAENVKPVIAPFRDAKTKGMIVLGFIALMGGTAGGQAEKVLHILLGR